MSEKGSDGMSLEELLGRRVDRRTVLRGAALASLSAPALALWLEACQSQSSTPGNTQLTWAVPAVAKEIRQKTADLWNAQHSDSPVRLSVLPEQADQQRQQIALELNAKSSTFDVIAIDVIWTGEFAKNGWLEKLDDVRSKLDGVSLPGALESAQWKGHLWAIPYVTNAGFLYYRKDLVASPPKSWDELMSVGLQAAKGQGIAPFVGQGAKYEGFVVNYLEYMWAAGGNLFNKDTSKVLFNANGEALKATQFMRQSLTAGFYAAGFNTMHEEEARITFQSGKAVIMRNWPYAVSLMNKTGDSKVVGKFDIAPLPTFSGQGSVSALGGLNNSISAYSKNKAKAKAFATFAATDPAAQRAIGEASEPPTLASVYKDLAADPVFKVLGQVLPDARPRPPVPKWNDISAAIQDQIFPAYNGEKDPAAAVEAVRKFLESTL